MICFTFPGQGSQRPGMGRPWTTHPSWAVVDEIADASGRDVAHLLLEADEAELQATCNAQLATFTLGLVALDAAVARGVRPDVAAGHSLGEYTALVAAGALDRPAGAQLVAARGDAMQAAADRHPGTMAAVLGLDAGAVAAACEGHEAWVANDNAPGQVVVGGSPDGVAAATAAAREAGARKVLPLAVGGAFHTPLMAEAADALAAALATAPLRHTKVPVVANVDARAHRRPDDWRQLLADQLCAPVRWQDGLHALADLGVEVLVELGAGTVLSGMAKRTAKGVATASVATPDDLDGLVEVCRDRGSGGGDGEHPRGEERLIVSPAAGVFTPDDDLGPGKDLHRGQRVGQVGEVTVRSAFAGLVAGLLALPGERVGPTQPLAWLRAAST